MQWRVPYNLRMLSEFLTFKRGDDFDEEDDDDNGPPPLEDCSLDTEDHLEYDGAHVVDPVFGHLDKEIYTLWREQNKEREVIRTKTSEINKRRVIPPVRYSQEAS